MLPLGAGLASGAKLAVSVNGRRIKEYKLTSGEPELTFIKASHLAGIEKVGNAYPLTVTLTRAGDMSGTLSFDRVVLGGGWQLGNKDSSPGYTEFLSWNGKIYYNFYDYYLARNNLKLLAAQMYVSDSKQSTQRIHFSLTDKMVEKCGFVYTSRPGGSGTVDFSLNGESLGSQTMSHGVDFSIALDKTKLKGGVNELKAVLREQTSSGAFAFDFYRLVPSKEWVDTGMAVIIR